MIRGLLARYRAMATLLAKLNKLDALEANVAMLNAKADGQSLRIEALFNQCLRMERENRLLLGRLSLPDPALWEGGSRAAAAEPSGTIFDRSVACRQEMFEQPFFPYWAGRLNFEPRYHRKLWEFAFIVQALFERGLLRPGSRGLGFGVGEEPLSALFASYGCEILATDMAPEAAAQAGWTETQQYAAGKAALRIPWICPDDLFEKNVRFQVCDMNQVPDSFSGFDFCWSACALEHLGSIEQGLAFIERSVACLKPGGYAVHTTELNVSSNDDTLDHAGTVLFRRRDFEALAERLTEAGHQVAPLDFDVGDKPLDRYIDVPPFRDDPHLKLALDGYATTSFGMIVRRAPEAL